MDELLTSIAAKKRHLDELSPLYQGALRLLQNLGT